MTRACVPLAARGMPGVFVPPVAAGRAWTAPPWMRPIPRKTRSAFGRAGSGRGEGRGAFPQVRLVALAECGTHAMFAVAMGARCAHRGAGHWPGTWWPRSAPGMLVLADRGFTAPPAVVGRPPPPARTCCWRAKDDAALPVLEPPGRTGLTCPELVAHATGGPAAACCPSRVHRIRPATIRRPPGAGERYRLVTTIADPDEAPARNWLPSTPNGGSSRPPWMR